jgi:hypothetical protein
MSVGLPYQFFNIFKKLQKKRKREKKEKTKRLLLELSLFLLFCLSEDVFSLFFLFPGEGLSFPLGRCRLERDGASAGPKATRSAATHSLGREHQPNEPEETTSSRSIFVVIVVIVVIIIIIIVVVVLCSSADFGAFVSCILSCSFGSLTCVPLCSLPIVPP